MKNLQIKYLKNYIAQNFPDQKLKPLTLKSIPKLREFVNDTLLDILFYTSPVYCQTIINTVVSEINRMFTLFMARYGRSISILL